MTSQFHLAIVRRCCQICGEYQRSGPRNKSVAETDLRKVFPTMAARSDEGGRPSQLSCSACWVKISKFRKDCRTNLLASQSRTSEEKLAIIAATRESNQLPDSLHQFPPHLDSCDFCQKFEGEKLYEDVSVFSQVFLRLPDLKHLVTNKVTEDIFHVEDEMAKSWLGVREFSKKRLKIRTDVNNIWEALGMLCCAVGLPEERVLLRYLDILLKEKYEIADLHEQIRGLANSVEAAVHSGRNSGPEDSEEENEELPAAKMLLKQELPEEEEMEEEEEGQDEDNEEDMDEDEEEDDDDEHDPRDRKLFHGEEDEDEEEEEDRKPVINRDESDMSEWTPVLRLRKIKKDESEDEWTYSSSRKSGVARVRQVPRRGTKRCRTCTRLLDGAPDSRRQKSALSKVSTVCCCCQQNLCIEHLFAYCTACAVGQPSQPNISAAERELAQRTADAVQELSTAVPKRATRRCALCMLEVRGGPSSRRKQSSLSKVSSFCMGCVNILCNKHLNLFCEPCTLVILQTGIQALPNKPELTLKAIRC